MTETALKSLFPNASEAFIRANSDLPVGRSRSNAKPEPVACDAALGASQVQKGTGAKFLVRLRSFRRRLLDEDNLVGKFHTDLCRYASIIPDDAPGIAEIKVSQTKVGSKEKEFVRIEIYRTA